MAGGILTALSIGYLVPQMLQQPIHFMTHSRFRHAINLVSDDVGMMALLGAASGNAPKAIRLNLPTDWDWRRLSGDRRVTWGNGVLLGHGWSVDVRQASLWSPQRDGIQELREPAPRTLDKLAQVLGTHSREQRSCNLSSVFVGSLSLGWNGLSATSSPALCEERVRAWIGCGPGLTPSGDDYLLGYLAALWPWQRHPDLTSHLECVRELLKKYMCGTTDISRFYLGQAVEGHFSESIHDLIDAVIRHATDEETSALAADVMNHGATSGADAMAGILGGLRTVASVFHRRWSGSDEPSMPCPQETYGMATHEARDASCKHTMERQ
ncbi:DUF2877 domain-containing protein [Dyella silvae]|uniref:DUF2877 domain-containing protein n=1 Tax=Dyella silvae TaxID=2994424 RepID=UPI0022643074|nr:DUF2877 domain-containing protein [Dyella silvae]